MDDLLLVFKVQRSDNLVMNLNICSKVLLGNYTWKLTQTRSYLDPNLTRIQPKLDLNSTRTRPKLDSNLTRTWPKLGPNSTWTRPELDPNSIGTRPNPNSSLNLMGRVAFSSPLSSKDLPRKRSFVKRLRRTSLVWGLLFDLKKDEWLYTYRMCQRKVCIFERWYSYLKIISS